MQPIATTSVNQSNVRMENWWRGMTGHLWRSGPPRLLNNLCVSARRFTYSCGNRCLKLPTLKLCLPRLCRLFYFSEPFVCRHAGKEAGDAEHQHEHCLQAELKPSAHGRSLAGGRGGASVGRLNLIAQFQ